ncbi:MAG: GMC family oxidoreductase [Chloroflexi bacterium]|nr:GMC family oxidoreductase [Chloroflexota bacterium]MDA1270282.1 GMC family oxidoreductase [Chloroflexota bacterium]PKB59433.1 MAG: choline dehydrogenase [SAR202 cluster bacterium Casp-Chloro-G2]
MANNDDIADVIVVGAGASGAAFTWSLAQAGINVVCLEQGGWVPTDAFPTAEHDAQLHWQTDFHPDPTFRRLPEDYPVNEDETPIAPLMYNAVGGSQIHWGAHFPRFHPSDFRVKTLEGVADDWPLTYEELEPYYDLNDKMTGVSGLQGDPAYPDKPQRPCPPLSIRKSGQLLAKAFDKLGWHWWASDTAISSVEYDGRDPDMGCFLRSFASSDLTYWPSALNSGARLETYARVREITIDELGNATGVLYYQDGELKEQKAKAVVLACNGVGTARLLLNSKSAMYPNGLANSSGMVGKCLMHHPVGSVLGIFDEWLGTEDGGPRGSTMLSQEFYETDPDNDFIRGYDLQVLAYGNAPLPAAIGGLLGQKVPWGETHHEVFKGRFGHSVAITIMTEDLPEEHNMVTLDPELTDSDGIPAPKLNYTVSENTARMLEHAVARATEVMEAAGAKQVMTSNLRRNAGWHLLGTARMGEDPETSVVDRWGRTHDVPNLFIIDGSVFTTSACVNPTPTIQALALRTADYLKGEGNRVIQ